MGTITLPYTFVAGQTPTASEWNSNPSSIATLVNGQLDKANVDSSSTDGIVTMDETQSITGAKTFSGAVVNTGGVTIKDTDNAAGSIQTNLTLEWDPGDGNQMTDNSSGVGIDFKMPDASDNQTVFASLDVLCLDDSASSEDGEFSFKTVVNASEAEVLTVSGVAATFTIPVTVGIDGTGHDVTFYGDTSGKYMLWDEDEDTLQLNDNTNLTFGTGADADIFYDGTDLNISPAVVGSGDIVVNGASMEFADSEGVTFGTGKDATIQYDGTNTVYNTAGYHSFTGGDVHVGNGQGLVVGHTAQIEANAVDAEFQVLGTSGADSQLTVGRFSADTAQPSLIFVKSRNATIANGGTVPNADDDLGSIEARPSDGTNQNHSAARILFAADGAISENDVPGRIEFWTTADGGISQSERMRIDSAGKILFTGATGASGATAEATADDLVIDHGTGGASSIGMSFLSSNNDNININFGDSDDADTGGITYSHSANAMLFKTNGATERMRIDSAGLVDVKEDMLIGSAGNGALLYLNDSANTKMSNGITIHQGGADDEILAFKSSDVAHPMSLQTEVDTYGILRKASGTAGGLNIVGLNDSDATTGQAALRFHAFAGDTTLDTTDTSSSSAIVEFIAAKSNGSTNVTAPGATENMYTWEANGSVKMLLKGNGDMHITNTTLTALDDEDDVALIRAAQEVQSGGVGMAMDEWDEGLSASEDDLRRVGVLRGDFLNVQRYQSLLGGGIVQVWKALQETTARLELAESKLKMLEA